MSERNVPSNGHGPTLVPSAVDLGPAGLAKKASKASVPRRRGARPAGVTAAPSDLQLRDLLLVLQAAERGDFAVRLEPGGRGTQWDEIATALNDLLARKAALANEMVRVERAVGREGRMAERVSLGPGARGGWAASVGAVNALITQLARPTTEVARVISAFAAGDLTQKMPLEIDGESVRGEFLRLGTTVNSMVDQLSSFAVEVTRVAKEVGTEGKLGGQAQVPEAGIWRDMTASVNQLANNLTAQVRNIAEVTTSVAKGDLSKKITVDARGEVLALKSTVNTMVDQLNSFASEVTRVAREVGTEGKLGGQAEVSGASGVWKELTENVNFMASNLTAQVRNIADVSASVAKGDLSRKVTVDVKGEVLGLKITINTMVDQLNSFASEVTRVAKEVGTEGKLGGQAQVAGVAGTWKDLTDNVNFMASNLTTQVRGIVKVVNAVANGDLRPKLVVEAKGEVAALAETINHMTDTLALFAVEVSTVAREVGVEGKLGKQASVPGVAGTWKDLTDNVNFMASNLTNQVRGIVKVVTAVANGDLTQKLVGVEAQGEIAALADTINGMCDTLGTLADQVTTVSREVGIEGKLGGQAKVPGAMGTWRRLTDNVNGLAGNLTTQVRAISDVATAVTKGDLSRSIDMQAEGEVASLKDNLNRMIVNLKETTQKNTEQDWLKTNLAKFSLMMQGQQSLETVSEMIMSQLTPLVSAHHGAFFLMGEGDDGPVLTLTSSYAYRERKNVSSRFRLREGLVGQCAAEKKTILLTQVPGDYIQISSGLGEAPPLNIVVLPVTFDGQVKAVVELASFHAFSAIHQLFLDQLTESIGVVLNMITASMRTEKLLVQSQNLTQELLSQSNELTAQQAELKGSNAALEKQALELEEKARLLVDQNAKVEVKNQEVELARVSLEEKAEQLALASKYKSEFLANMSHELRTPLNSLLILASLLAENGESNLTAKQVEFAQTIYTSGGDLLTLINEILDLSKVESGKMEIDPRAIPIDELREFVERSFRPIADHKGLTLDVELSAELPATIRTDPLRLEQVLKNLLANAFKFTTRGGIALKIGPPAPGTRLHRGVLNETAKVIAFTVSDTGIGIPPDKHQLIFEAFQQADGTTSRQYGGTGLGLSISREITRLLGGEIHVASVAGKGSIFTLYLPQTYAGPEILLEEVSIESQTPSARDGGMSGSPSLHPPTSRPIEDDRDAIVPGDRVLLVIEDDLRFARIMVAMARDNGFKVVAVDRGDSGLALANELQPDAIALDIQLPVLDGWSVLERLKRNPRTRHIPVHVISIVERSQRVFGRGAFAYLQKPVSKDALEDAFKRIATFLDRRVKVLLIVEDDDQQRQRIVALLGGGDDVKITAVRTMAEALQELEAGTFDCMVVDLVLPGQSGFDLIEEVKTRPMYRDLPVIIYTAKELSDEEQARAKKYAHSVIVKTGVASTQRLVEDTSLFLHRMDSRVPKRAGLGASQVPEDLALVGKTVLVVDDDVRNIFAMSSVLESRGLKVVYAENGNAGIDALAANAGVDIVLMDVMMPGMDGYDTIRTIRANPAYQSLPIIAVTAKALKEDRKRCMDAGASDYLPKPVDVGRLLGLLATWTRPA